jgi:uncharacterized membrane protein YtjA (UPF0391 family)
LRTAPSVAGPRRDASARASDDREHKQAGHRYGRQKSPKRLEPVALPWVVIAVLVESEHMLKWALIFFLISIVAGFFGYSGVSAASAGIAKLLFIGAIIIAIIIVVAAISLGQAVF